MTDAFPVWVIVLDYTLGTVMWTLIGRFGMNLFLPENSGFFFMRFFRARHQPLTATFCANNAGFLLRIFVPLYVAWFFYLFRFYLMPWLLGYSALGMLSFPLEGDIAKTIYDIYKNLLQ